MARSLSAGLLAVGLAVPLFAVAGPAAAASTLVVGLPGGTGDCAVPSYLTISSAVAAASDGDTIEVCPGTYAENVSDTGKDLTFSGAQAGVDARGRSGAESVVDGGGGTAFTLSGTSVVDGFTLTGATTSNDTPAAFLQAPGEKVTDTVFSGDNTAAIITSTSAEFAHDSVVAPSSGGYGFFFNSGGGSDSSVHDNAFSGNIDGGAINVADPGGAGHEASNLSITHNTADTSAGGNFAVLGGTTGVALTDNTVTGGASSGTAILLLGDDSQFTITRNRVSGVAGASAVSVTGGFGYADNGGGVISTNSLKNNLRGVNVVSDTGTIEVHENILVGNTSGGTSDSPNAAVRNTTGTAIVNAQDNFYGCNTGPGTAGCDAVLGNVTSSPYLVLSSTIGASSLPAGGSTTFTADLDHDNTGAVAPGSPLAGEPVAFSFDKGTVTPATSVLGDDGTATTSVKATGTGTGTVKAQVDNATTSKTVTIAGVVRPAITVHDTSTAEGNSGTHLVFFRVTLGRATTATVTVRYTTANGSATAPSDYRTTSGTLTFSPGTTSLQVGVPVVGDKVKEANETFALNVFGSVNASIADPVGTAVVRNDD